MKILSIQKDHLASVCVFEKGNLIYYNQEERLSRKRKDSGVPFYCIEQVKKLFGKVDRCVLTGYDTDVNTTDVICKYLTHIKLLDKLEDGYCYNTPHHLSHAAKAYYSSGFKKAIIFVVDGMGSTFDNGYETTTVFKVNNGEFETIHKKFFTDTIDIGQFYGNVSKRLGWNHEEGKLMGLSAYGKPNKHIQNYLHTNIFWQNTSKEFEQYVLKNKEDLAFETQSLFERVYMKLVKEHIEPGYDVIMTGGTALNVVNNYKIRKALPSYYKLFIDPICGDEGNCIGIGAYYIDKVLGYRINKKSISQIYLNPMYQYDDKESNSNLNEVVDILTNKNVVAFYQGRAEAGPRALGNRSLLLDPSLHNGKQIMNEIKHREPFRPFACVVLEEEAKNWFEMDKIKNSPHMMYAVKVKEKKKSKIPSVVHVDGTCRIQTVNKNDNAKLYNLLKLFYKKTKIPILMNTSFNVDGEPIVETPKNAIDTFQKSSIKYLYYADLEKLCYKK